MENLYLKFPSLEDEEQWRDYVREYVNDDANAVPLDFHRDTDYQVWLNKVENEHRGICLASGRVPVSVYFLIRDERIVAHIAIRHHLHSEFLSSIGGHIGYGVRPSERRKGYATLILKLGLKKCQDLDIEKVMISCKKSNIGSKKTIEKNGGLLTNERFLDGEPYNIYWIDVSN